MLVFMTKNNSRAEDRFEEYLERLLARSWS